jgi:hypothetical protein
MGRSGAVEGIATRPPLLLRDDDDGLGGAALLQRLRDGLAEGAPWVGVETDGTRLARDRAFALAARRLGARVHLRVAGCSERAHRSIHGRDLRRIQRRALDACADLGLAVALLTAVRPGVNDGELGDIALLGLEHPAVRAAAFRPCLNLVCQPVSADDLVHGLSAQLPGMLRPAHFTAFSGCRVACLLSDGEDVVPVMPSSEGGRQLDWLAFSRTGSAVGVTDSSPSLSPLLLALPASGPAATFSIIVDER